MKKRIFTLALALILCLSLIPMCAMAADISEVSKVGDTADFGTFFGKPIEWQVLEIDSTAGKALLIPTELIGFWAYNSKNEETIWENSSIRKWLNDEFYNSVFSDSQRAAILETDIENKANPNTGVGGGVNTKDKVFLLSYDEANKYFSNDGSREAEYNATEAQYSALAKALADKSVSENWYYKVTYDEAIGELSSYVGYTDWWWLRTSGPESGRVACVNYNGSLDRNNEIFEPLGGLRPAIWVNIKASSVGNASEWATPELEKADELGLIPDILKGADLTKPITRGEFAAVCVKTYENLAGTAALPVINNPFKDTNDIEILKAFNIGVTNGYNVERDLYEPNILLNRETMATMLTRVFKRTTLAGWTLETDGEFTLPYTMPALFLDDANISAWARESVYFMTSNEIIKGYDAAGGFNFKPRNLTEEDEAVGYAQATREMALVIAVRMVENLGK
ncbi:MAG: DUF6273 domain-containing protein [Oscillospiraceae bacterium]|jgi:hypothetical protein|nr:DUF6273 domain-containing protein [Oscillospiraceae bacterium]